MTRAALAFIAIIFAGSPSAALGVRQHYAPIENLEHIDAGLLGSATNSIDIAAYVLTDRPAIDDAGAAERFGAEFERVWGDGEPVSAPTPAE